jgi:hypothetical protein
MPTLVEAEARGVAQHSNRCVALGANSGDLRVPAFLGGGTRLPGSRRQALARLGDTLTPFVVGGDNCVEIRMHSTPRCDKAAASSNGAAAMIRPDDPPPGAAGIPASLNPMPIVRKEIGA